MDKHSLAQLIEISRAVGTRTDYVQVGGGNTSVKSPDGRTMAIKASGTALTDMSESAGWVEVDIAAVLSIFGRTELAALESDAREARVLQHFSSAVVGGTGRPSVETALHAMLGKFVIHTHPVAANALNCGPGQKALAEITAAGELPPLWVPYTDPGWRLAHFHQIGGRGLSTSTWTPTRGPVHGEPRPAGFRSGGGCLCGAPCGMGEPVRAIFPARQLRRSVLPRPLDSVTLRKAMVSLRARMAGGEGALRHSRG